MNSEIKSFNIVAIELFDDCALHIRKVLSEKWYFFTAQYVFDSEKKRLIKNESYSVPSNFYGNNISIQAIVGMNGSGKSCILECVFRIINNISYKILHNLQRQDSHELVPVDGICAEVYFNIAGKLISIGCDKHSFYYKEDDIKTNIKDNEFIHDITLENKKFLCDFCYTIVCNYSQHAYNALTISKKEYHSDPKTKLKSVWLNGLFHKNDGYLTPIVLNPYRVNGNINFNTENYLSNVRLASLFIALKEKNVDLIDGYEAVNIRFTYDSKHFLKGYNNMKRRWDATTKKVSFEELSNEILNFYDITRLETSKYLINIGYQYLIYKTLSILEKYPSYTNSYDFSPTSCEKDGRSFFLSNLGREVSRIQGEDSHITLKIKQILNYIKNPTDLKKTHECAIEEYIQKQNSFKNLSRIDQIITEFLPSFFSIDTVLYKKTDLERKEPIPFESMSSGERQFLVVMASVMYHLKNINSIPDKATLRIKYKYIFLVLEEIELYFHPEYQRRFIYCLTDFIKKLDLNFSCINICIATHSPFILSDIPKDNILFLENGIPLLNDKSKEFKTFGANIFDILQSPFFMKDGFVGKFAWEKITRIKKDLEETKIDIDEKIEEISTIDEPHIQSYLLSKLEQSKKKKSLLSQRIELEQKLAQINRELSNDKN